MLSRCLLSVAIFLAGVVFLRTILFLFYYLHNALFLILAYLLVIFISLPRFFVIVVGTKSMIEEGLVRFCQTSCK